MGIGRLPALLPITSLPFWDVAAAVKEVRRCAAKGHKGILFTGEPQSLGQPLLGDPQWNPLWETAVEFDLPISFHIGSGNMELGLLQDQDCRLRPHGSLYRASVDIFLRNGIQ